MGTSEDRIAAALAVAVAHGGTTESHHQSWVIDQMVRALVGADYEAWVARHTAGEDGPATYVWETGIPP